MFNSPKISLFVFLFLLLSSSLSAQSDLLNKSLSLDFQNSPIQEILESITNQTSAEFAYDALRISPEKPFSIVVEDQSLKKTLALLFQSTNIEYQVEGTDIILYRNAVPKFTLSGYLRDAKTGEALINANVYDSNTYNGTHTNEYGFFSITLSEGKYDLVCTYIGYEDWRQALFLFQNQQFDITLKQGNYLSEVVVVGKEIEPEAPKKIVQNSSTPSTGEKVSARTVDDLPLLLGEKDMYKVVQLSSGIHGGDDASSGLFVRGGGSGQNLMLLDGVPVYNVSHAFGFFSIYNGYAVNHAEVHKGGFPARYGGRLSSVLDVRMKEGNNRKINGNINVGFLTGGLMLEGPLKKDKTSFLLTSRRTWLDLILVPIANSFADGYDNAVNYWDMNAKINHKINDDNRVFLSMYIGNDKMLTGNGDPAVIDSNSISELITQNEISWGNRIVALRWNRIINPKLFSNATLTYSNYGYLFNDYFSPDATFEDGRNEFEYRSKSSVIDYGFKLDFDYFPNPKHEVRFGGGYVFHNFKPLFIETRSKQGGFESVDSTGANFVNSAEVYAYVEDEIKLGNNFIIHPGLRIVNLNVENAQYISIEPRLSLRAYMNQHSLFLSYSRMAQFVHAFKNTISFFPSDIWMPSTAAIKPEYADILSLDYTWVINRKWEIKSALFYKRMNNLIQLRDELRYFSDANKWEEEILVGSGESYGFEFGIQKKRGKLTGWINYARNKSDRTFPSLNEGKSFPFRYERKHNINVALNQRLNKKVSFGLIWNYGSGAWITLYNGEYINSISQTTFNLQPVLNNSDSRHNYRFPDFHRLDIAFNFEKQKKRGKRMWTLGVYNLYARGNPINIAQDGGGSGYFEYFIPFPVPYLSYSFKF